MACQRRGPKDPAAAHRKLLATLAAKKAAAATAPRYMAEEALAVAGGLAIGAMLEDGAARELAFGEVGLDPAIRAAESGEFQRSTGEVDRGVAGAHVVTLADGRVYQLSIRVDRVR